MGNATCGSTGACGGNALECGERKIALGCCDECVVDVPQSLANPMLNDVIPGWAVELLVSPIAELHGVAGYHTSVLVGGSEYFYGPTGIVHSDKISSHRRKSKMQRMCMGTSTYSGKELVATLEYYFPPGHYDVIRKNCNAFTDCALYFLCGQRLSWSFRSIDKIGLLADQLGLIQKISAGEYTPNPHSLQFDVEAIILELSVEGTCNKLLADLNGVAVFDKNQSGESALLQDDLFRDSPGNAFNDLSRPQSLKLDACKPPSTQDWLGVQSCGGAGRGKTISIDSLKPPSTQDWLGVQSRGGTGRGKSISIESLQRI